MSVDQAHNDKLLVKQLIVGNEKAFEKLFNTYRNMLYKYCYGMVASKPYAEEIVQEVFLTVWEKRTTLNPDLSFKSFLFTVTRNKTIIFLKRAAKSREICDEIFYNSQKFSTPADRLLREKEVEQIKQEALDLLPARRRLIFEMSRNESKSYEEIAKELGLSINTVKNQMSKALSTLREYLLNNGDIALTLLLFCKNWL